MSTQNYRLYKHEKLCSLTAINLLFTPGRSADADSQGVVHNVMAYPWRAAWRVDSSRAAEPARFLISVGKKRLRHAVDRVTMRRRCREAYRLNRHLLPEATGIDVAFMYVGNGLTPYHLTEASMRKMLSRICSKLKADE